MDKPNRSSGEKESFSGFRESVGSFSAKNAGALPTLLALLLMLLLQGVAVGVTTGSLATLPQSWLNILLNNTYTGLIALGMCLVIVSGGIDLSVGSLTCAVGAVLMYLIDPSVGLLAKIGLSGVPAYCLAVLLALAAGTVLGEINGLLVSYGRIPPFIVTLGTMKIFRSVTQQLTRQFNPTVPTGFKQIASMKIGGKVILPTLYWILAAVILHILFRRTAFGKQVVAVGSNERAARYAGIPIHTVRRRVYAICGTMCALAAVIYVARLGSMDFANAGSGFEMDAIAAAVVGGTAMAGGKGSMAGAFFGMLIIGVMNNILNLLGVPTYLCDAVRGAIIIFAVLVQRRDAEKN